MRHIEPRITRREIQRLIRQKSWKRLAKRLEHAPVQDLAAHWPALHPKQQTALFEVLMRRSRRELGIIAELPPPNG